MASRYFTTSLEISPGFLLTALPLPCSVRIEEVSLEGMRVDVHENLPEFIHGALPILPKYLSLKPGDTLYILEAIGANQDPKKAECKFFKVVVFSCT